jgi:hypothetical protein
MASLAKPIPGSEPFGPVGCSVLFLDRAVRGQRAHHLRCPKSQATAHVDQVVGDDSQSHPALHSVASAIAATLESMASLHDADAPSTSGAPVRHFCPCLNQRCFSHCRRAWLRVFRLGIDTCFTPRACINTGELRWSSDRNFRRPCPFHPAPIDPFEKHRAARD